jgi:gliding motility-associated-like protein
VLSYDNPNNYQTAWSRDNALLVVNIDSLIVTTAGTYKLRVQNDQCFDEYSATYEVKPKPVFSLPSDMVVCKNGQPMQFFPVNPSPGNGSWSGPGINTTGRWDPASLDVPDSGPVNLSYLLIAEGCSTSKSFTIDVGSVPEVTVSISEDTAEINQPVTLSASGGIAFSWSPADGLNTTSGPSVIARVPESRTYKVEVSSAKGCKAEKSVDVIIDQSFIVYDAFSPNGDQKNDVWSVKNIKRYAEARVKIFNRWGNLVFESDPGYPKPWDGTFDGSPLPPGAYYYIIELGPGLTPKSGSITLVR